MNDNCYPFELLKLPYEYNTLEPQIDEKTMKLHHDKHLGKYVSNLNSLLENNKELQKYGLKHIICNISLMPHCIRQDLRNNAGGVYNHNLYFKCMINEKKSKEALKKNLDIIKRLKLDFTSLDNFFNKFKECALEQFGSGYSWLAICKCDNSIQIINTANQDCVIEKGYYPLLLVDVWEHSYYLKYNNRRNDYLDSFMKIINWEYVNQRYIKYMKNCK